MSTTVVTEAGDVHWLRAGAALAAAARRQAGQLARGICMSDERVARVELCVTELATNLLKHATDGALALRVVRARDRVAVECLSLDSGPGIDDIPRALRDGTSATGSLGIGLGAVRRLADSFGVHSLHGRGTAVHARFWAGDTPPPGPVETGGLTRPISGEQVCGDTWAVRTVGGGTPGAGAACGTGRTEAADLRGSGDTGNGSGSLLLMCDGLGHGPLAARVADRARGAFRDSRHTDPVAVLADIHQDLRGTRGAAVAVAFADPVARIVRLAGVGNISALVVHEGGRNGLMSLPGIVGGQMPRTRAFEAPFPPGAALVLHSDGLSDRWKPADFPGLFTQDPALVAAQLLNQAAVRRDDAGIVVAVHRRH
uniref:ATP-binding protein/SpoIIE family protein phosphatase n=1 Tax=Streptomyces corallincola TaxID=2851888 RepID=UPI0027E36C6D|nr:ATP-binding protein/SpoIIE family protein phosphatase [Streptomyces corallincola]